MLIQMLADCLLCLLVYDVITAIYIYIYIDTQRKTLLVNVSA